MKFSPVVVLDNGAWTIKTNVITKSSTHPEPWIAQNAVIRSKGDKRTYFGHEFEQCHDHSSLHFRLPFERGYLTDWDAQKAVWDGLFSQDVLGINPPDCSLLITEPYFNLPNIQDVYDQFLFEEYDFQSYFRCTPASLIPHGALFGDPPPPECMIVVDAGFSFTHVVPIMNGSVVWKSVRRLDIGGKLLTNHLKELVSFRQWNMMDETYIVNEIKEACCYVSNDYRNDMEQSKQDPKHSPVALEYILPNFSTSRRGRVKAKDDILSDADQVLLMNNERFTVPEVLFRPTDIGLNQSGLSPSIAESISSLPSDLQGLFWANIGLIGGNTKFRGFRDRLMTELRCLAPDEFKVNIYESPNAITEAYLSGVRFASSPEYSDHVVSRAEYQESGSNACRRKFHDWRSQRRDAKEPALVSEKAGEKEKSKAKGKTRARFADDNGSRRTSRVRTKMK